MKKIACALDLTSAADADVAVVKQNWKYKSLEAKTEKKIWKQYFFCWLTSKCKKIVASSKLFSVLLWMIFQNVLIFQQKKFGF